MLETCSNCKNSNVWDNNTKLSTCVGCSGWKPLFATSRQDTKIKEDRLPVPTAYDPVGVRSCTPCKPPPRVNVIHIKRGISRGYGSSGQQEGT